MAIVVGIMLTQVAGLRLATPHQWRYVLLISAALSVTQIVLAPFMVESPAFIRDAAKRTAVAQKLWGSAKIIPNRPLYAYHHFQIHN